MRRPAGRQPPDPHRIRGCDDEDRSGRDSPAGTGTMHREDAGSGPAQTGASGAAYGGPPEPSDPGLRRHGALAELVLAGLVLRVLSLLRAYRPRAVHRTLKYLYNAWPGADPLGFYSGAQGHPAGGNVERSPRCSTGSAWRWA